MNNFRDLHLLVVVLSMLIMLPATALASRDPLHMRFVRDFRDFAGSDANAQSLYDGLKYGTRITLAAPPTTTSRGSIATPVVQFDPPTRPMGNGNVFISAALAKQQLAYYGITEPTPQQLQAVLTSGTIRPADGTKPVVLKGILVQRADGMGWSSIAKNAGMKIGNLGKGFKPGITANASASSAVFNAAGSAVSSGYGTHTLNGGSAGSVSTRFTAGGGADVSPPGEVQGQGLIRQ
jgi:hypothetical protein